MQAELISIGDEILIGQTLDTNATFIARKLNAIGISVKQKRTIADKAEAILEALDQIHPQTKLVFMTGGLGPTNDDITKKTLNEYFQGEMVFNSGVFENIKQLFQSVNRQPGEAQRQQAFLPSVARVLINKMGTASGMHFERGGVHYFSVPGVPYEAEHLVEDRILPWIIENLQRGTVVHRTLLTQGVPESDLAQSLFHFEAGLPPDVSLAYLPSPGMVKLRLSSYEGSVEDTRSRIDALIDQMKDILGEVIFGEDAQSLEEVIGISLLQSGLSLSMAESCTGGHLASLITRIPGSSAYFKGGVVAYAVEAKENLLGLSQALIRKRGVVSEEVALAMAQGARARFASDFGVSTTGIAGPSGGTEQNPVGTVWIGIAGPDRSKAWRFRFGSNRERNIRKATVTALNLLRREIQKIS